MQHSFEDRPIPETISYLQGDATQPQGQGPKVVVHICNDVGAWGKGFVVALGKRWPISKQSYLAWAKGPSTQPFGLGEVQFVEVADQLWIGNLIGQHGIVSHLNPKPIRYEAVTLGLASVAHFAHGKGASVHMPRIGTGLAGGSWPEIEAIIERELLAQGLKVYVYDLE
jgi:O-acetyl-ADP-ribose deacetylase (regulator of RNase III)